MEQGRGGMLYMAHCLQRLVIRMCGEQKIKGLWITDPQLFADRSDLFAQSGGNTPSDLTETTQLNSKSGVHNCTPAMLQLFTEPQRCGWDGAHMNPKQCLQRAEQALADGQSFQAFDLASDLMSHLNRGGAAPEGYSAQDAWELARVILVRAVRLGWSEADHA